MMSMMPYYIAPLSASLNAEAQRPLKRHSYVPWLYSVRHRLRARAYAGHVS